SAWPSCARARRRRRGWDAATRRCTRPRTRAATRSSRRPNWRAPGPARVGGLRRRAALGYHRRVPTRAARDRSSGSVTYSVLASAATSIVVCFILIALQQRGHLAFLGGRGEAVEVP